MALIYKVDGSVEKLNDLSLEGLQNAVGGYIQLAPNPSGKYDFICDEEGKLKGKILNAKATILAKDDGAPIDFLVGDVVIAKKGEIK